MPMDCKAHFVAADTIIFLDVDGVLNVVARDENPKKPLLLSQENAQLAERVLRCAGSGGAAADESAAAPGRRPPPTASTLGSARRLAALLPSTVPQEAGRTFASFACAPGSATADVLVGRLARLIQMAGARTSVVLSSAWRKPSCAVRVKQLELQLSTFLGRPFVFDACTSLAVEAGPADRLRCIGDFVAAAAAFRCLQLRCPRSPGKHGQLPPLPLRVLVLEDFFISPACWSFDGHKISSAACMEQYLRGRAPPQLEVDVKVAHTFALCDSPCGLRLLVGCGLTMTHFLEAAAFLSQDAGASWIADWCAEVGSQICGQRRHLLLLWYAWPWLFRLAPDSSPQAVGRRGPPPGPERWRGAGLPGDGR